MTPTTPTQRKKGPRLGFVIAGAIVAVLAFGSAAVGGVALYVDGEKDAHGFVSTDSHEFRSGSSAIVTENMDVNLDGTDWLVDEDQFGNVRIQVESDKPVFAGVARTEDVERYLKDVSYSTVANVDYGPFAVDYDEHVGDRRPSPPANRTIWTDSVTGTGTQDLEWNVRDGDWSIVVMNADGSPGIDTEISAGAKFPFLDEVAWIGLGTSGLLAAGAIALLVVGFRRPRDPSAPVPTTTAAPAAA
ncbi:MAG TPA: hypothetical protein VGW10_01385 [Solirubrobacteraceae bacterium]|nr:hypothetical protein [Solirubrobacteraceae bacterium]